MLLCKYCDVSRIKWINHTFTTVYIGNGFYTVKIITEANPDEIYDSVAATFG